MSKKPYGYSTDLVEFGKEASLGGAWITVFVFIITVGVGGTFLYFNRWAEPFNAETTYIATKQSSAARDGAISKLTTLKTNWDRVEDETVRAGIESQAVETYNIMAHKDQLPEYLKNWLKEFHPGLK